MGFREKLAKYYQDSYLRKYGDRLTQIRGNVLSVKIEAKPILWIFHRLRVVLIVRPERSKGVVSCVYKKNRWFKKPAFISISMGNLVIVQGLKGKKGKENRETIEILNVLNLTTKKDLVPVDNNAVKKSNKVQYKYK
ncbi:MAG: hypothetical protein Q8930_02840 [Bacillota bacterium]|nr:hypothetical protein [Bacillota bacterium]